MLARRVFGFPSGLGDFDRNFTALDDLRREMDQWVDGLGRRWGLEDPLRIGTGFDLSDEGEKLVLRADVPGFRPEKIEVTFDQGTLFVRGERTIEAPEGHTAHHRERRSFQLARAFQLPARVQADKIEATVRDGVLEIALPKAPEERPRTISIHAA